MAMMTKIARMLERQVVGEHLPTVDCSDQCGHDRRQRIALHKRQSSAASNDRRGK